MAVTKRRWKTSKGESREVWIVDYRDQGGDRHIKTFDRRKDADAYHATVKVDREIKVAGVKLARAS
jgi:integrase